MSVEYLSIYFFNVKENYLKVEKKKLSFSSHLGALFKGMQGVFLPREHARELCPLLLIKSPDFVTLC